MKKPGCATSTRIILARFPSVFVKECAECKVHGISADEFPNSSDTRLYQTSKGRVLDFRCMPCFELYNFKARHVLEWHWRVAYVFAQRPDQEKCLLWMLPVELVARIGSYLCDPAMEIVDKCDTCKSYHLEQCPLRCTRNIYPRVTPNEFARATRARVAHVLRCAMISSDYEDVD